MNYRFKFYKDVDKEEYDVFTFYTETEDEAWEAASAKLYEEGYLTFEIIIN